MSRCPTGQTCDASGVTTATVCHSKVMNSTSYAWPSRYISTTVPNIAHNKAFSGNVSGQYDLIEFLYRGPGPGFRHG